MTTLLDDLERLAAQVADTRARFRNEGGELRAVGERLAKALTSVEEAWSGSNLGYHADLYFEEFTRPSLVQRFDSEWGGIDGLPEGWRDRTRAEVQSVVEERSGASID